MKILIRKLPKDTHSAAVKALVRDAFPKSLFFGMIAAEEAEIVECKRYRVTEPHSGFVEDWCLLRIRPESAAAQVVKKLHAATLGPNRLLVHQYFDRGPTDRRALTLSPKELAGIKGRMERRRKLIIEPVEEPEVSVYRDLARVYST